LTDSLREKDFLELIVIDRNYCKELCFELNHYGVNHSTVFPNLDGLSAHVNWISEHINYWAERQKDEESDKFRAVAQVWREVAEQFRQENESLRNKIDGLSEEVKEEAFAKADSLEIDLDFSDEKPILSIGDAVHKLPQLPAGDNKEKG